MNTDPQSVAPSPGCMYAPIFGGPGCGPTVVSPAYQLVMNAVDRLPAAHWDVATWADRVHRAGLARAAALSGPTAVEASR